MHHVRDLITLFNRCFEQKFNTVLEGGANEPVYLPQSTVNPKHRVIFRADYFASALHEVAHWCVAGTQRRQQEDYGYWYAPDGRTKAQQAQFERVEVYPQALEWMFSVAAKVPFRVSADNLSLGVDSSPSFKCAIAAKAQLLCAEGPNPRAWAFIESLASFYGTTLPLSPRQFDVARLG